MITLVDPSQVYVWWDEREPQLALALRDTYHQSIDDLLHMCLQDQAQLWIGDKCTAVTVVLDGDPRILQIVAIGGNDIEQWINPLVAEWRAFAKRNHCAVMVATGRPGWKRVFNQFGFRVTKITGVCEV